MRKIVTLALLTCVLSMFAIAAAEESPAGDVGAAIDGKSTAATALRGLLDGFPEKYIEVKLAGPADVDAKGEDVDVRVEFSLRKDAAEAFIAELGGLLDNIAEEKRSPQTFELKKSGSDELAVVDFRKYDLWDRRDAREISLLVRLNESMTRGKAQKYLVSPETAGIFTEALDNPPALSITLLDGGGNELSQKNFRIPRLHHSFVYGNKKSYVFFPLLSNLRTGATTLPNGRELVLTYNFKLFEDDAREVRDVRVELVRPE